jgi:hypothetical protein
MNIAAIIFPYLIIFLLGVSIGGVIEFALKGRSNPRQPLPPSKKKLTEDGDVEVFEAWRTGSNSIYLSMDGKRLDNKEALLPEQHQRLLNLVLDLRPWLETGRTAAMRPGAVPQPSTPAGPESGEAEQPVRAKKGKNVFAGEEITPLPVTESIIEQIDRVLQGKLAASSMKERGIRLTEGPGGIVIIKVGTNTYEGVDSVPDLQVKAFIQQAVADWEKGTK